MGNGFATYGGVQAEAEWPGQDATKGRLTVLSCWNHDGNWVELSWRGHDNQADTLLLYVDQGNGDSVELVASLLEAVDRADLAETLRADTAKLEQRTKARRLAMAEFTRAVDKAKRQFLSDVSPQRQAYAAAIEAAEKAYEDATGEKLVAPGSVELLEDRRVF